MIGGDPALASLTVQPLRRRRLAMDDIVIEIDRPPQDENRVADHIPVLVGAWTGRNKAEHQRLSEQLSQAEVKIAKLSQEHQSRGAEIDSRQKDFQNQLGARARKIQELEAAVENLAAAKFRLEKDVNAKATVAEGKAKELGARLAAALKERKELEARHAKELEDQASKHKVELERREQVKAQEVVRLQQAVQEKSKALKVVELELTRYRAAKPGAGPAAKGAAPASGAPRAPAGSSAPRPNASGATARPAKAEKSSVLPPGDDQEDWDILVDKLDK